MSRTSRQPPADSEGPVEPESSSPEASTSESAAPAEAQPVLNGRWQLTNRAARGAFGELFVGIDLEETRMVAIKLERAGVKPKHLERERQALETLAGVPEVCRLLDSGRHDGRGFLVTELGSENLSQLRRRMKDKRLELADAARLARPMLTALEAVHEHGYLHRDVKLNNFVLFPGDEGPLCKLIDFGLATPWRDESGTPFPYAEDVGFTGTRKYGSVNALRKVRQSRRDDLWSFFYCLVLMVLGRLPWSGKKSRRRTARKKEYFQRGKLVQDLPREFKIILAHLNDLEFETEPPYRMLDQLLETLEAAPELDLRGTYHWSSR